MVYGIMCIVVSQQSPYVQSTLHNQSFKKGWALSFKRSCIQVFYILSYSYTHPHTSSHTHAPTHTHTHPHTHILTHTHTDDNSKLSCGSDQGSGYPANEEPAISVHWGKHQHQWYGGMSPLMLKVRVQYMMMSPWCHYRQCCVSLVLRPHPQNDMSRFLDLLQIWKELFHCIHFNRIP